jgi:ubiquinone/menaquinone biosynthesis C-methylase UbiE
VAESDISERVSREKTAYDSGSVFENSTKLQRRFSHVFSCPNALRALQQHWLKVEETARNAALLDYGCFDGAMAPRYRSMGAAHITGIDISTKAIERARSVYGHLGTFVEGDAHCMPFEAESFDLVVGKAILHHLDLRVALREIDRVLKPGGRAYFIEPLGDNPGAKLIRALTPLARTNDERPLSHADLIVADSNFSQNDHMYSNFLSTPVAMFTSLTSLKPDNLFTKVTDKIDMVLSGTSLKTWFQTVYCCWIK